MVPVQVPQVSFRSSRRHRLQELIDRAARRRVTLLCAPAGAGKTVACSVWAAARSRTLDVIWVTFESQDDQAWCWARVWDGLQRSRAVAPEAVRLLAGERPAAFPLRLVELARDFAGPVVIVFDNVDLVTSGTLLGGLDLLVRHAPPTLRLVLSGRRAPGLQLAKLRAAGDLAEIGAADLAAVTSG